MVEYIIHQFINNVISQCNASASAHATHAAHAAARAAVPVQRGAVQVHLPARADDGRARGAGRLGGAVRRGLWGRLGGRGRRGAAGMTVL